MLLKVFNESKERLEILESLVLEDFGINLASSRLGPKGLAYLYDLGTNTIDIERYADMRDTAGYRLALINNTEERQSPPVPTIEDFKPFVDNLLNTVATKYGYDNIISACSYINSTVDQFKKEGVAFCQWRDTVWQKSYEIASNLTSYVSSEEFISKLPTFENTYYYMYNEMPTLLQGP